MRGARCFLIVVLAMAVVCASASAETASVLLQEGVYAEEVVGDLDRAIETYKKVIADAEASRRYVAEAHYRLGKCYLAKGDDEKAREQFQQVVDRHADQRQLAAAARGELEKLVTARRPQGTPTFGPVIERVVNDDAVLRDCGIDLDTGQLFSIPYLFTEQNEALSWIRERGLDAGCEIGWPGLGFADAAFVRVNNDDWNASPEEVMQRVAGSSPPPFGRESALVVDGELPATCFFRTREGGMDILQIVGFTDDPKGVKIRYKLLESGQSEPVRRILVPDVDVSRQGLDLDDGELVQLPKPGGGPEAAMSAAAAVGADLVCDHAVLILVEGTVAEKTETVEEDDESFKLLAWEPGGNVVTTRAGNRFEVVVLNAGNEGVEISFRRLGPVGKTEARQAGELARLADLRIRLAEAQADMKTKEAEREAAVSVFGNSERLHKAGRLDGAALDRARVDQVRASAEYDAARQKVEILTREIARLELVTLQPPTAAWRTVTLPEVDKGDTPVILDLATGGMLPLLWQSGMSESQVEEAWRLRGKGDLCWEDALIIIRGGKVHFWNQPNIEPDLRHESGATTIYRIEAPAHLSVTTGDGQLYEIKLLSTNGECVLEYRALPPTVSDDAAGKPDPARAAAMLPVMKTAFASVCEAVERGDAESALQTMSTFLPRVRELHRQLEGTPAHGPVGMAIEQLEHVQKALESGNLEQAQSVLDAFDFSGPQLEKLVEDAGKSGGGGRHGEE